MGIDGATLPMETHCCANMSERLSDDTAIRYIPEFREYGSPVLDGGSGFVVLRSCPWCGAELPLSLRYRWFETLEGLGLDPYGDMATVSRLASRRWAGVSELL